MIQLRNVSKTFYSKAGNVIALKDISLTIDQGTIFGVIGFSGAGKSTLLRLVNGLELPDSGSVLVQNKDITKMTKHELNQERKKIGMVFQQFHLLNAKTVYDNIAIPLVLNKVPKEQIEQRVNELLAFVELSDKKQAYPDQLSGGQKQRVGIARALATNPSILLCDEATSALDPKTTSSILQLLKKINKEFGITILMITHEMNVIREICHRVAVMEEGIIVEEGSVANVFGNPQTKVAKNFVRTIVDDSLPQNMLERIKLSKNTSFVHIRLHSEKDSEQVFTLLSEEKKATIQVIQANINEWQGISTGTMLLEISGPKEDRNMALSLLETTKLEWKEVV